MHLANLQGVHQVLRLFREPSPPQKPGFDRSDEWCFWSFILSPGIRSSVNLEEQVRHIRSVHFHMLMLLKA